MVFSNLIERKHIILCNIKQLMQFSNYVLINIGRKWALRPNNWINVSLHHCLPWRHGLAAFRSLELESGLLQFFRMPQDM